MKVALVYNSYDSVSGETVFFSNMLKGMRGRGIEIIDCPIPQAKPGTLAGHFDHYLRMPLLLRAKAAVSRIRGADAVHFLNSAIAPAGAPRGIPCIATVHFTPSMYLEASPPRNPAALALEKAYCGCASYLDGRALKKLERLVACSPHQAEYLRCRNPQHAARISFCPPGIDAAFFRGLPKEDLKARYGCEAVAVYAGRLHERSKGVSHLIDAVSKLRKCDVKLLIIGDGPDLGRYRAQIRNSGLDSKVHLLGRLGFYEKSVLQRSADMVIIPSLYEVFGTVFAETLACGVPAVAFDLPFWKRLYDGAGIFVKPLDSGALAQGMERLQNDSNLRKRIVAAGKPLAESYDLQRTLDSYLAMYEGAVQRP
ncbi:glycosyltransferase family 4 protein [Candidatus Micrarchaeota archaeon]|nr:glycosyltransferase family 4 protein [Candidatus Micrarchaeota archaeon]